MPSANASRPLLARILYALKMTPEEFASLVDEDPEEINDLLDLRRGLVIQVNRDAMWVHLDTLVSERIAALLSVREELSRKLAADRQKQLVERLRVEKRL